jgi:NADH:ubiquinone oxidoreductase subunit 4 (subunit M)
MLYLNLYNNIILINTFFNIFNLKIYNHIFINNFFILYLMTFIIMFLLTNNNLFVIKKISLFLSIYVCFIFVYLYIFLNNFCLYYYSFYKISELLGISFNIEYSIGIDNISYIFLILTALLFPLCFLISWNSIYYQGFIII